MNVEWKAILDALMEGAEYINIYSYRLSDGSYIMAEEMEYDSYFDVLFLDLPVLIKQKRSGIIALEKWNKIIAKTEAPVSLKRDYIKYNFLDKLHGTMDEDEFKSMVDEIHSYDLDKKDSSSDPLMDMYNKRLRYPYRN